MEKTIVIFYSKTGSNKYLAEKISKELKCDIEEIRPFPNIFLIQLLRISLGNLPLKHNLKDYNRVIMCGPIWMGQLIAPLKNFVTSNSKKISQLIFVTCCASTYASKDDKFGHNLVFQKLKNILGQKCVRCEAFPIGLVIPEDKREDSEFVMKTHLSDENFNGEIKERFDNFIHEINISVSH